MLLQELVLIPNSGPQTFQSKDAPRYVPAEVTIIVCWGVCLIDLAGIYLYCIWKNKQKASVRSAPGYVKLENQEVRSAATANFDLWLTKWVVFGPHRFRKSRICVHHVIT